MYGTWRRRTYLGGEKWLGYIGQPAARVRSVELPTRSRILKDTNEINYSLKTFFELGHLLPVYHTVVCPYGTPEYASQLGIILVQ